MGIIVKAIACDEKDPRVEVAGGAMVEVELNDDISGFVTTGIMTDSEGVFFQRQLEYIQANSYDVLYPDLKADTLFSTNTEGGEGINTITYRSYDKRGETAVIAGKATDLPRADIDGKEYSIGVRTLGSSYGYSRQELAAAKLTGMPLDARKAEAVRRSYMEKKNQLVFFGDADNALNGLFGGLAGAPWDTVQKTQVANPGSGTEWANKTPDEIIADLNSACAKLYADTLMIFRPNMIIMSVAAKQILRNTPRSLQSDMSILDWFVANSEFITSRDQIVDVNEIKGIYDAAGGTFDPLGGKADGFTVGAFSMENARIREPFPMVHLPVQYKGLEFEINAYGRFASLEMIRPDAFQHFYGIGAL